MPNTNRWRLRLLASLVGVVSLMSALPVEARPVYRSPHYRNRPLGPVPYTGPVITHIPIGSVTGSSSRWRSPERYYSRPNTVRYTRGTYPARREVIRRSPLVNPRVKYYRDAYPLRREVIRRSTIVTPTTPYYRESAPVRRDIRSTIRHRITYYGNSRHGRNETIRDSTLINPTIINSEIDDSVLINPTIVNPRSDRRQRGYEGKYPRRQYHSPSSGIYIQFSE